MQTCLQQEMTILAYLEIFAYLERRGLKKQQGGLPHSSYSRGNTAVLLRVSQLYKQIPVHSLRYTKMVFEPSNTWAIAVQHVYTHIYKL